MDTNLFFFFFFFFFFFSTEANVVEGSRHFDRSLQGGLGSNKRLFVFGDSYVDTGNTPKSYPAWKAPYGTTFPERPDGRFSDGRVLTDYLATFLGIRSPIPYRLRKDAKEEVKYGMNFGHGGTGVFDTRVAGPNMTIQINYFEQQVEEEKVYTKQDLDNSIALATISGNDYTTFIFRNRSLLVSGKCALLSLLYTFELHVGAPCTFIHLPDFIRSVTKQISINLKRIHDLGVQNIVVTSIEPFGCLPSITALFSYKVCNELVNLAATLHNHVLQQVVQDLNNVTHQPVFIVIDLHGAFLAAMKKQNNQTGTIKFGDPLRPCCVGVPGHSCGDVDENGMKKYEVCENPSSSFFWDDVHPTQEGWYEVFSALQPSLNKLL
ncbi:GDSL lipase/esterase [Dillenia turbinata]|uniref:GDSL lipase/esterase n=1 Tax=Dillenia turbinata TaxID=194707 RepID=A0AAN8ZAZ0_9MAGN